MGIEIFCSYAHEDKELVEKLITHLGKSKLTIWHDKNILPGEDWAEKIGSHLEQATIILFLVSPDFVSSDYCCDIEVPRAMERHNAGQAYVIPVILRPVYWKRTLYHNLQCLPANAEPVTNYQGQEQEKIFVDIVAGIWAVIEAQSCLSEGDVLFKRRDFAGAFARYSGALEFSGSSSILYEKKGDAAFNLRHFADAEEAYDQAIKLNPAKTKLADLWEKKTDVFYSMLKSDRVTELTARDPMLKAYNNAYNMMLEVYNETEEGALEDGVESLNVARKFLTKLMRSKGNRLAAFGELEKALEAYEEAIKWRPNNYYLYPDNYYLHIEKGEVLFKINRLAEAFLAYNEVTSDNRAPKFVVDSAKEGRRQILMHLEAMERQRREIFAYLECEKQASGPGEDREVLEEGL